jgi:hypothetical protein
MTKFRLSKAFDDHAGMVIGYVEAPVGMDDERQEQLIREAWDEFKELKEEDEEDNIPSFESFPYFLRRQYGFKVLEDKVVNVELE